MIRNYFEELIKHIQELKIPYGEAINEKNPIVNYVNKTGLPIKKITYKTILPFLTTTEIKKK